MRYTAILFLFPCLSLAGELSLAVSVTSHHFKSGDYNERNPGIGVEYKNELTWMSGVYRNSQRKESLYAGVGGSLVQSGRWSLELLGGVVTGYERANVLPYIAPSLVYRGDWLGGRLILIPPADKGSSVLTGSGLVRVD